jgi:NADP-dependent 3-hydroxy acid dehydrogenase YdfG
VKNHLEDKVIVITGAGGGFGRLVAEMACELGAKVVGADINDEQLAVVFDGLTKAGKTAAHLRADVTDLEQMKALADFAVATFGRIDVMVNNAGVMPLSFFADHEVASKAWDTAIDINIKGVLNGIAAVHDQMIAQGRGHIVNLSSIYGNFATAGAGVYTATKSAVNALSESLRVESQGKIKVSVVRPSGVPRTGLGGSVVNPAGVVGIFGQHESSATANLMKYLSDELPTEQTDVDSPQLWSLEPEHIAENIIYVMNQPWGVSISDITIRATGEEYVL